MKKKFGFLSLGVSVLMIALIAANFGCSKDDDGGGGGPVNVLSGIILAPDSVTPVAGATIYVPVNPTSSVKTSYGVDTSDCPEPDESYIVYTCTDVDGSFALDITAVTQTAFVLRVKKGSFSRDYNVNLNTTSGNLGSIAMPSDPAQGAGKFAVVTGSWDRMQDILAKLGMGELDEYHELILGTETFDLYDGNYSLGDEYPYFPELFETDESTGDPVIYNYDMVFINCGNSYEYDILYSETSIAILRDYVNDGGKLYITDLSYDYVEQVFPEYIDFYGSDETAETERETMNDAQVGDSDITSDATINDSQLALWLQYVKKASRSRLYAHSTLQRNVTSGGQNSIKISSERAYMILVCNNEQPDRDQEERNGELCH